MDEFEESGTSIMNTAGSPLTDLLRHGFAPGQELSAHHAPYPATIQFIEGEASLLLGTERMEVSAGAFAYMTPNLEHGIKAKTKVVMLLTMVKGLAPRQ